MVKIGKHGENIRKRKDGRWEARYPAGCDENGRPQQRSVYGKTYLEAKRKRKEAQNDALTAPDAQSFTFGDITLAWLNSQQALVKESTYAVYANCLRRHILPVLGDVPMSALTSAKLDQFLQDKLRCGRLDGKGGLSGKTVADIRAILKMILQFAQTHGCPGAAGIRLPSLKGTAFSTQTLTPAEQAQLEQVLFSAPDPLHLGILISLYAGLRIGEVCALQWKDFDFENGTVSVDKTLIRIQDFSPDAPARTRLVVGTPKTHCSRRTIPLPDCILQYFQACRGPGDAYLLTGTACCQEPRQCLAHYKQVLRRAGVADHSFHALRHTFATRCVASGFDIKSLSEIMGHASVAITMQRYVHPTMEMKRSQMNRLDPLVQTCLQKGQKRKKAPYTEKTADISCSTLL